MISSAAFSALHLFGLAIGLPGLFLRGRALQANDLPTLFRADNAWALAAVIWLGTGLYRVLGGLEKGTAYYQHNSTFWLKMSLFGLLWLLELYPMITFIRWRFTLKRKQSIDFSNKPLLVWLNRSELAVLVVIPFVAAAMARGIGY